jgi:hypothetical protein
LAASATLALLMTSGVAAEGDDTDREYPAKEMIHADLPLYSFADEEFWPRSIETDGDAIAGCTSRVRFGNWQFTPAPRNEYEDPSWYRFANYGVFHCAAIMSRADERAELDNAKSEYGFFVRLGEVRIESALVELWALQVGTRPGSNYTLLSRIPKSGIVDRFTLLQQECPKGKERKVPGSSLDIWSTGYCAINDRADLLALAKKMARLEPLGEIILVPETKGAPDN